MVSLANTKRALSCLVFVFLAWSCLIACKTVEPARTAKEMAKETLPPLTLSAGDVIDVKFFFVPELDENQIVRPDGFVTLQLVGDLNVQGQTPAELHEVLVQKYRGHLKNPNITIMVRRVNDGKVWVGGEVKRPGPVQMTGRMTVLDAVMDVGGGVRPTADLKHVLVVRQKENRSYGCLVNLKEVLEGKESEPFTLQPRDVVYVPPTTITKVDDWIDQYINKVVPQTRTIFTYPIGPGNAGQIGIDTTNR